MATMTKAPKQVKASKGNRLLRVSEPTPNGLRLLSLTKDGVQTCYYLWPITVDFGRGFQLDKFDTEESNHDDRTSHVHLAAQLGDSCTCKGWCYRSKCKHVDSVKALVALGKL